MKRQEPHQTVRTEEVITMKRAEKTAIGMSRKGGKEMSRTTGHSKIYPIKWTQQEEGFLENGHKQKG